MPSIKDKPLTVKQAAFAQAMYTPGSETFGNGAESARKAQYEGNNNTLRQTAHKLVTNGNIIRAKAGIEAKTSAEMGYSIETYRQELDEARQHAQDLRQPSAEVSAIVAKGRSCGYDKDNDMGSKDKPVPLSPEKAEKYRRMAEAGVMDMVAGPKLSKEA